MAPVRASTKRSREASDASVAAAPAGVSAEKKSKVDPSFSAVVEALEGADLPETCRLMLTELVFAGLQTPAEDRHELQTMAVTMIGGVLATQRSTMEEAVREEDGKLTEIEAGRGGLDAQVTKAEDELAERAATVEARKKVLQTASLDVVSAKAAAAQTREVQRQNDVTFMEMGEEKKAVEAALVQHFEPMKEGNWETAQAKVHIGALVPLAKRIHLDSSLVSALPSSCTKKPAERGPFDQMVVAQLEELLKTKVTSLAAQLDTAGPAATARAVAAEAAQSNAEAATARQQQAAADVHEAMAAQRGQAAVLDDAKSAVENFEPKYKVATAVRDQKKALLERFVSLNVAAFETLRDATGKVATDTDGGEAASVAKIPVERPEQSAEQQLAVGGQ